MLRIIRKLEPPGVGARDLRECLLLQLEARNETGTLAYRLVKEAFEDLKAHRWSDLAKRFGLDAAEVQRVADELARLDPKPGLQYSAASDAYIIPDLVVEKIDGKYHVFLNDGGLPRLRISKTYQEIARDKKKFQGENKDFINQRLNSARSIKAQIQKMVDDEDTKNPLTDQQIVEMFAQRGVKIARRTVAKYRDQLGILPARMRKRL